MNNVKLFYIKNIEQADFFIKNGLKVTGCGKDVSKKTGEIEVYINFLRDDKANEVFDRWCNRYK